ncbi:leucine-rich repeat-containing protein 36 isoform X1 [Callorhinchus milii]|uniref:leucine-rich repeat-containing protein 36 isoform X1 n=1 Tax=Callorhinchus milii TaxID=7868 RepID=UPI001C3F9466|nr:leucine-rich repeat-containing protein 36 isoform X1 [Callorhinchus milii]
MASGDLVATEAWIRDRAQLGSYRADEVESLSLQGTYSDKIVSLGDAFQNFKRLKCLDLSRNSIDSLGGLEYLPSLEKLNMYYNNVASSKEISRLCYLTNLRELDLRLNPVTRNEDNFRLFVVHMLPNLQRLDDRLVRESERKAAHQHFSSQEQKQAPESDREDERIHFTDHAKKNYLFDKDEQESRCTSMKYKWNAVSDFNTDLKERRSTHDFQLTSEPPDSVYSHTPLSSVYSVRDMKEVKDNYSQGKPSTDTLETENSRNGQYFSYLNDEDYKTYQSPTRSSLRSTGKTISRQSREGYRVTFADRKFLDTDEKTVNLESQCNSANQYSHPLQSQYSHPSPSKYNPPSPGYSKKESLLQTRERNMKDYHDSYQFDTPVKKDSNTSIDRSSILSHDYHKPCTEAKTYQSNLEPQNMYPNLQGDKAAIETNSDRLYKWNSDFKAGSTYGSRKITTADEVTSTQRARSATSGLTPHHRTSSSDSLLDRPSLASPSSSFTSIYSNSSKRAFAEHVSPELAPSKSTAPITDRQSHLIKGNVEPFEYKGELKKSSSQCSLLFTKPNYERKTTLCKFLEAAECGDYRSSSPPLSSSSISPNVSSVLKRLIDLIDRHWNGSRSLQLNQRFLIPAHELLSSLVGSVCLDSHNSKIQSLEKKVKVLTEENKSLLTRMGTGLDTAELYRLKHQISQKQDDIDSLKGRLAKILDENNKLRSQLTSLELVTCAGNQQQNKELQRENEKLNLEVEYLNQQIKQYSKLQETVSMLQESHR